MKSIFVKSKSKMVKSIKEYDDLAAYLLQKNFNLIIRQRVLTEISRATEKVLR